MFYLRARGINEADARKLLIYAFASEIVDRMKIDVVREQIRGAMFHRIPNVLPERRSSAR
jgi:Fe-S cluster assembly protein SufD